MTRKDRANPPCICQFEGCGRPAEGDLCAGHRKQRQRGGPLTPLRERSRDAWPPLSGAAIRYADASAENEGAFARARRRLRRASFEHTVSCLSPALAAAVRAELGLAAAGTGTTCPNPGEDDTTSAVAGGGGAR